MGARVLSVTLRLSAHTARACLLTVYLEVIGRKHAESRWFVDSSMPGLALGGLEVPGSARHRLWYLCLPSPPEAQAMSSLVTLSFH